MDAINLARRLAGLGQSREACQAYTLALSGASPEETMEAAVYILQSGGNYRVSYTCFQALYKQGHFKEDCLSIMTQAFYEPNVKALKKRYEKNCKLLAKYPYIFRKDFVPFEDLPIRFYPYDDKGYVPFFVQEERFGDYLDFKNPVVSRNFFKDLDNPILADNVFSQYELEYLHDNVRDSERVGRENHVYLHYTDWAVFCAHLQVLNLRPLLEGKKLVFLIETEIEQYPIDFKERFGIDYSQYTPQPIGIREVNRLIWHTQLSAHNGGDFFNEVFDAHPNLLAIPSVYPEDIDQKIHDVRQMLKRGETLAEFLTLIKGDTQILTELYCMGSPTDKDIMVMLFLGSSIATCALDQNSRIAPAVFFQPHFPNIRYNCDTDDSGRAVLKSQVMDQLHSCQYLNGFQYIKTFTPMRRITNSYAASIRFAYDVAQHGGMENLPEEDGFKYTVNDSISERILNRSYLIDPEDRLYKDSILVRFEDGKLNPKATFTALAAFLDLPYTQSMTVCTQKGEPVHYFGSDVYAPGFDPESIYRTYDEFANDTERYYIEYFMRDAYEFYGYDFNFYDGAPVDEDRVQELIAGFTTLNRYIRETWQRVEKAVEIDCGGQQLAEGEAERIQQEAREKSLDRYLQGMEAGRLNIAKILLRDLKFVNGNGQPLRFMPLLKPDPALLEQPLYH